MLKKYRSDSEFGKIFSRILAQSLVIIVALTLLLFISFQSAFSHIIFSYTQEQLYQIHYSSDKILEKAKNTLTLYAYYGQVLKLMNYDDLSPLDLYETLRNVQSYGIAHMDDEYICIYNPRISQVYLERAAYRAEDFPDRNLMALLENNAEIHNYTPVARKIGRIAPNSGETQVLPNLLGRFSGKDVYTLFYRDQNTASHASIIAITLPVEKIYNIIHATHSDMGDEIIIVDSQGIVNLGNSSFSYLSNISEESFYQSIRNRGDSRGYSIESINGGKYMVSYISSSINDWVYLRITPYAKIAEQVNGLLLKTIFIASMIVIPVLILGALTSKNIHGLLERKIADLYKRMKAEKEKGYETRQWLLRSILTTPSIPDQEWWQTLNNAGIRFNPETNYGVILFAIDHYERYQSRYSSFDRDLYAFGINNIISEVFGNFPEKESVYIDRGLFVLICTSDTLNDVHLPAFISTVQINAKKFVDVGFSVVIGDLPDSIDYICNSYYECLDALKYRVFLGENMLLPISQIRGWEEKEPENAERTIQSIIYRLIHDENFSLKHSLAQLFSLYDSHSCTAFKAMLIRLPLILQDALVKSGSNPAVVDVDCWLIIVQKMLDYTSLDDVIRDVQSLFEETLKKMAVRTKAQNNRLTKLAGNVERLLQENYADTNLTPEWLATHLGISPEYFRKLFKSSANISISSYINKFRLDKAVTMLIETDTPIVEIAAACGFANTNYFYTLFKKDYGITAGEYRNMHQRS